MFYICNINIGDFELNKKLQIFRMGSFSSKLLKNNCTEGVKEKDKSKDRIQVPDPRSPTGEIVRTPITFEKDKINPDIVCEVANQEYEKPSTLMRQRLMKNLKLDPRSPTEGISRTPIFLDNTHAYKSSKACNSTESPLSIYSNNFSNSDSFSDIATPEAPSVNVSGFENYQGKNLSVDAIFKDFSVEDEERMGNEERDTCVGKQNITKTPLKVSSKPSTIEARQILNEILASKEFDQEFILDGIKQSMSLKQKTLSLHCDNPELKVNDKKKDKLKHRTPLSNITLSSNSPNNINSMKKPYARCKILSDVGLENSVSPKVRQIAEWDKDKTIII